ncbi:hypothetical protein MMC08_004409 [Hypocenomyce scalaris]|nr:hypothetical protein [Hypocenomyce scalaris]
MPEATSTPEPALDLFVRSYLHDTKSRSTTVIPQFAHRLALTAALALPPGSHVLEIGCGQAESTVVLAHAVGPGGGRSLVGTAAAGGDDAGAELLDGQ